MFFSSGAFIMIATTLRAYYSLRSISDLPIALGLADREGFVASITIALPGIKPLFKKAVWFPNSTKGGTKRRTGGLGSGPYSSNGRKSKGFADGSQRDPMDRYFEMTATNVWRSVKPAGGRRFSSDASEEEIMIQDVLEQDKAHRDRADIVVTREFEVLTEEREDDVGGAQ